MDNLFQESLVNINMPCKSRFCLSRQTYMQQVDELWHNFVQYGVQLDYAMR